MSGQGAVTCLWVVGIWQVRRPSVLALNLQHLVLALELQHLVLALELQNLVLENSLNRSRLCKPSGISWVAAATGSGEDCLVGAGFLQCVQTVQVLF